MCEIDIKEKNKLSHDDVMKLSKEERDELILYRLSNAGRVYSAENGQGEAIAKQVHRMLGGKENTANLRKFGKVLTYLFNWIKDLRKSFRTAIITIITGAGMMYVGTLLN